MIDSNLNALIIISPGFPRDENDTTCLPAQQAFVKALMRVSTNLNIVIVALQYPPHENEYHWFGHLVIPFNSNKYGWLLRPVLWAKISHRLDRIDCGNSIGILSFWYSETALIGRRYSRRRNLMHLCWILGQDARKNQYARWFRPMPDELVALSDFLADEFYRNHRVRPSHIVPNAVDPLEFKNNSATERPIDILGVGSLIPLKRYDQFVEVVASLKKDYPSIRAVICGQGPEEGALREKIDERDLQENLSMAGEIEHEKALAMMQQSKILLHPSSYEGYSSACLEALYAGCHVISFTRAENQDIDHWHVVATREEMVAKAAAILKDTDFSPVLVHTMEDTARKMIELFK